jgi:hypothetical protein
VLKSNLVSAHEARDKSLSAAMHSAFGKLQSMGFRGDRRMGIARACPHAWRVRNHHVQNRTHQRSREPRTKLITVPLNYRRSPNLGVSHCLSNSRETIGTRNPPTSAVLGRRPVDLSICFAGSRGHAPKSSAASTNQGMAHGITRPSPAQSHASFHDALHNQASLDRVLPKSRVCGWDDGDGLVRAPRHSRVNALKPALFAN